MGGSISRVERHNDELTGLTVIDRQPPTLSLAGTTDGLYRISRNAEAYFHQVININPAQKGNYPVVVLKGVSHLSFMQSNYTCNFFKSLDMEPEVS